MSMKDCQNVPGDDGVIHGSLCRLLTGHQPRDIAIAGGCLGGFSIQDGVIKVNSWSMNAKGPYMNDKKPMDKLEEILIEEAVKNWVKGGCRQQNWKVNRFLARSKYKRRDKFIRLFRDVACDLSLKKDYFIR